MDFFADRLLDKKVGRKVVFIGNEAIARGALEAGIGLAATYPGTPSSEIGDSFATIAKQAGIYFEYSTNEKVALEVAAAAAMCGIRSMTAMKHYGLNVALDSFLPMAYLGVNAGFVVAVADDPSCWSSGQGEEDTRYIARLAHVPMLEPSDAQECKDLTKYAFELSEKFKMPVLLRMTTRVDHGGGIVKLGLLPTPKTKGLFVKDFNRYNILPPGKEVVRMHKELHEKLKKLEQISENDKISFVVNDKVPSKIGVITSGVSFNYVMEALDDLGSMPVLKLGMTYPLPEKKIKNFANRFETIIVVEELDPILEENIRRLAPGKKIIGKELLPIAGEYKSEDVLLAIAKVTGKKVDFDFEKHQKEFEKIKIPSRGSVLCPGCPHRSVFYATKLAGGESTIFPGDIGCYILGMSPQYAVQDFITAMGASIGFAHGFKKSSDQNVIAILGDSTFFHSGIPPLINAAYNKSNPVVIVLDNRITAMTGHQPNPGMGITAMGEKTKEVMIETMAKTCGVDSNNVKTVDPYNFKETCDAIKNALEKKQLSVIVARRECQLVTTRKKLKEGIEIQKFEIDPAVCKRCGICLRQFGCPAIHMEGKNYVIDEVLCTGCSVCAQICPYKAIKPKKVEREDK
jgi:indolepyruvate ferredoxin oxidoreductase alpha subunit